MAIEKDNTARFVAASRKAMAAGITDGAKQVASRMKEGMSRIGRFTSSPPGTPPNIRRNRLRNSIVHTLAEVKGDKMIASAGSNVFYGRVLERGKTIWPTNGKALVVPINNAAHRISELGTPIKSLNLVRIKSKTGKWILIPKTKVKTLKKGGVRQLSGGPVFILLAKVTIKARPWAAPGLAKARADGSLYKAIFAGARNQLRSFDAGVVT